MLGIYPESKLHEDKKYFFYGNCQNNIHQITHLIDTLRTKDLFNHLRIFNLVMTFWRFEPIKEANWLKAFGPHSVLWLKTTGK